MKRSLIVLAAAPLVFTGGCATESLFFSTKSSIGVDVSAANGAPRANIGYDRTEAAIVPAKPNGEAHAVLGGIDADLSLNQVRIKALFATGKAAKLAASKNADSNTMASTAPTTATGPTTDQQKLGQPIVFAADASLSLVNIQISNNGLPGSGSILYRRAEATLIPVKPEQNEVASVYANISIDTSSKDENKPDSGISWIEREVGQHPTRFPGLGVRIVQSFATGMAAEKLAQDKGIQQKLAQTSQSDSVTNPTK